MIQNNKYCYKYYYELLLRILLLWIFIFLLVYHKKRWRLEENNAGYKAREICVVSKLIHFDCKFQYWENRLVCASISRTLLPKRNRQHRTSTDVFKTNAFEVLTFAIKRIWHRHVYPAYGLLVASSLKCIATKRSSRKEHPPLWHTFSHLLPMSWSILICLFRNKSSEKFVRADPLFWSQTLFISQNSRYVYSSRIPILFIVY